MICGKLPAINVQSKPVADCKILTQKEMCNANLPYDPLIMSIIELFIISLVLLCANQVSYRYTNDLYHKQLFFLSYRGQYREFKYQLYHARPSSPVRQVRRAPDHFFGRPWYPPYHFFYRRSSACLSLFF